MPLDGNFPQRLLTGMHLACKRSKEFLNFVSDRIEVCAGCGVLGETGYLLCAQNRGSEKLFFADDICVMLKARRRRDKIVQRAEIIWTTDFLELAPISECLSNQYKIDWSVLIRKFQQQLVKDLVRRDVKGIFAYLLSNTGNHFSRREQKGG